MEFPEEHSVGRSVALPFGILAIVAVLTALLASCYGGQTTSDEILIALKPESISLLAKPEEPDPIRTGIPSLDSLNRRWNVQRMVRVFPDVSPEDEVAIRYGLAGIYKLVVPRGTDLALMIKDYQADPNIAYAELNQRYEIK